MATTTSKPARTVPIDSRDKKDRYVIDLRGATKCFSRQGQVRGAYSTLKSLVVKALTGQLGRNRKSEASNQGLYALNDLTLRIPRGSAVGIIGRNGSGKSTLLKLISGIYRPSSGTVSVNGSIAALIELGAGFHPDFSGRENVYLSGVMHGLSRKQIDARFDQIVEFAELTEVIDEPVRTYSSGMFMRLGFSVAVHTNPDILIVDEVLAVGDAAFVVKCQQRLTELRRAGKTLLLVTHDLNAVQRWCDEAVWLEKGEVLDRGEPRRVIDAYRQFIEKGEDEQLKHQNDSFENQSTFSKASQDSSASGSFADGSVSQKEGAHEEGIILDSDLQPERWGSREVEITHVELRDQHGESKTVFHPDDAVTVRIEVKTHEKIPEFVCGIGITRTDGVVVIGTNTQLDDQRSFSFEESGVIYCRISRLGLNEGTYTLDVALHAEDGYPYDYHLRHCRFAVRSAAQRLGLVDLSLSWEDEEHVIPAAGNVVSQ